MRKPYRFYDAQMQYAPTALPTRNFSPEWFWAQTDRVGECWLWRLCKSRAGYGYLRRRPYAYLAHRVAYMLAHGDIPTGLYVCHTCDTPSCVNPAHLFAGTGKENMQDAKAKGRTRPTGAKGERNSHAKLTELQVIEIRRRRRAGETSTKLMREFGVSHGAVLDVVKGKTWRHVQCGV